MTILDAGYLINPATFMSQSSIKPKGPFINSRKNIRIFRLASLSRHKNHSTTSNTEYHKNLPVLRK